MLKDHEKFWAFMALGFSVLLLAVLAVAFPTENETAQQVMTAAMGALSLALGAAANALFRIKEASEYSQPQVVEVQQPANQPVPTTSEGTIAATPAKDDGELPESDKL
jgi:hypothetical protein